jgi:ribosomal protein S18 acetylase RimI-like enzyme
MKARILPAAEWPKLAGTLADQAWPVLPADAQVIVVEDGDQIVGNVTLFKAWHLEGAWVRPDYRGSVAVGRHLLRAVRDTALRIGAREVYAMAVDDVGRRLSTGLGEALLLECEHYAVRI